MKVLLVNPEIRLDANPYHFPFWAGILASIVEKKGGHVAILDLNAIRMNHGGMYVPNKIIESEISSEKWDIIGIGGLTTTYGRNKQLLNFIRKNNPTSIIITGGGWCTYNPDEIIKLIPVIDLVAIGEGEETFSDVYDVINGNSRDFDNVDGLCINKNGVPFYTAPRALISDLNTVPYPYYDLFELDIYFNYSSFPYSLESFNSKRRISVCWERGCPRGCTFCSHNGMSRIDLQNILGQGDRRKGELIVRDVDKKYDTFSLPARWPTPEYAVNNVKLLKEKFDVDFISIVDENMTSNKKWTEEFCKLYINEGLNESVKWGTLGDAPSVATQPHLLKTMVDAGCSYISFGFESASNKVLAEDIQKGQTREHLQKTIEAIKSVNLTPLTTFMIGNMHENINDLLETVDFWIQNDAVIDPFICTPYIGSPIYYDNRDMVLEQYDYRLKLVHTGKAQIEKNLLEKWKLDALDKFMKDCGDATQYTATVSQYFTISELISLKRLMFAHDIRRILQMAHQQYDLTKKTHWLHSEKWVKHCDVCKSTNELTPGIKIKQM